MALSSTGQEDFSGGMYRGRRAPANAFYDGENALINDEGLVFRRGATAYRSGANAGSALEGLVDGYVAAGQRTVFWSETGEDIYTLDSNDSTVITVSGTGNVWRKLSRGVVVGGVLWLPGLEFSGSALVAPLGYGGSRKTSDPATFSATVANGSKTVTSTGTSWATTADAGMILTGAGGSIMGVRGVVAKINSNTSLDLLEPWSGASTTASAELTRFIENGGLANDENTTDPHYLASAGRRLLMAQGSKIYFTDRDNPFAGDGRENYHQLPEFSRIIGADSILDVAVIFTTAGVWAISDLVLDPVDSYGNIRHTVERVSKDVILWGDPGIAAWSNALIVPAIDDVYVFSLGAAPVTITGARGNQYDGGIRDLYRGYVKAGYQPGLAAVHRGHYFLPILNGMTLVDVLVCRLDRGFAWTRWTGHAAGLAYAQRVGSTTRSPKLLGTNAQRVTDLSNTLDVSLGGSDADGTTPSCVITTRDFPTGQQPGFVQRARLRYEMTDAGTPDPTVAIAFSSDADAGSYTTLTERGEQGGAAGWGVSDGSKYAWALVGKRRERIRFRITQAGAAGTFVLRTLEVLTRPQGKQ